MRIVVTGATGNVGTALVRRLASDSAVTEIVGIARRTPGVAAAGVIWRRADVSRDTLTDLFRGADAVVHLAWEIQPSHDPTRLWRTNVLGSLRVFRAACAADVPTVVHASSVGVYSPGPSDRPVDEGWPRMGVPSCLYAVHKAEVERHLDRIEEAEPGLRVVRMRPGLTFAADAAAGIGRLFAGPLIPRWLLRRGPFLLPDISGMRLQAVHSDDVAEAYRLAATGDIAGAVNVAAEPVLDLETMARAVGARTVRVPRRVARAAMAATWRARLQPTPPGWLDMGLEVPWMDTTRARSELGWVPARSSIDAFAELVAAMGKGRGAPTPALRAGRLRSSPPSAARRDDHRKRRETA